MRSEGFAEEVNKEKNLLPSVKPSYHTATLLLFRSNERPSPFGNPKGLGCPRIASEVNKGKKKEPFSVRLNWLTNWLTLKVAYRQSPFLPLFFRGGACSSPATSIAQILDFQGFGLLFLVDYWLTYLKALFTRSK